jgi:thiol-disulfide isomerase/thioredoxin
VDDSHHVYPTAVFITTIFKPPVKKTAMKKIRIFAALAMVVIATSLLLSSYNKIKEKKAIAKNTRTLPLFTLPAINGAVFNSTTLLNNSRPCIIFYFEPDCDHCQFMASSITAAAGKFDNYDMVFISPARRKPVEQFHRQYGLQKLQHLTLLTDSLQRFPALFGTSSAPSFFVYDNNKKMVKKIIGETKIEHLLN